MLEWRRSRAATGCGSCESAVPAGEAFLLVRVGEVGLRRCRRCALRDYQIEPPADLAPLGEPIAVRPQGHLPTGPSVLPFDYKAAAVREPGEDDE